MLIFNRIKTLLLIFAFLFGPFLQANDNLAVDNQYPMKAVFIFKFTDYLHWKDVNLKGTEFVIGVLGQSDIIPHLVKIAMNKTVKSKVVVVDKYELGGINAVNIVNYCDILFVPTENSYLVRDVVRLANHQTVIIGEEDGFAKSGGSFNFVIIDNKLKFELNKQAVRRCGIQISNKLLQLAIPIDEDR